MFLSEKDRGERYVLSNCKIIEYIKVLEYHSHLLAMRVDIHILVGNIGSLEIDLSGCRCLKKV